MKQLTPAFFCLILFSCTEVNSSIPLGQSDAYAPVYASTVDVTQIAFEPATNTTISGKIYATRSYIFQSDINKGIHIIDKSNSGQPKKIGFLKVPFSTEIAVKGNYLYTNNLNDLVVFDISNINSPQLVKRIENMFPSIDQKYPPVPNAVFECPDPSKGLVVRWEKRILDNPKCRR